MPPSQTSHCTADHLQHCELDKTGVLLCCAATPAAPAATGPAAATSSRLLRQSATAVPAGGAQVRPQLEIATSRCCNPAMSSQAPLVFYSWCVVGSTCKAKAHSNIQTNTANALAEPLHMLCLSLHGPSFSWSCCVHAQVYACPVARTPSSWHKLHFQACQRHSTPNIHHLIICDV